MASQKRSDAQNQNNTSKRGQFDYKIAVVGPPKTGKTSICKQFCYNRFSLDYTVNVDESHRKQIAFEDRAALKLEINDRPSNYGGATLTPIDDIYKNAADGFLVVFSVTNRSSVTEMSNERKAIQLGQTKTRVPMLVVVNMIDLITDPEESDEQRGKFTENMEELEKTARTLQLSVVRASARNRKGVVEAFQRLIETIESDQTAVKTGLCGCCCRPGR